MSKKIIIKLYKFVFQNYNMYIIVKNFIYNIY